MSSSERAGDAIDLIVATINALIGILEHAILPELFEGGTPAQGVAFPEDIGIGEAKRNRTRRHGGPGLNCRR
jgi:hypothetical protein